MKNGRKNIRNFYAHSQFLFSSLTNTWRWGTLRYPTLNVLCERSKQLWLTLCVSDVNISVTFHYKLSLSEYIFSLSQWKMNFRLRIFSSSYDGVEITWKKKNMTSQKISFNNTTQHVLNFFYIMSSSQTFELKNFIFNYFINTKHSWVFFFVEIIIECPRLL